jgi:Flp pilus assembly protein TadD
LTGQGFEYFNNIGFSYILQGKYPQAEDALERALDMRPGNPTAMNNLALLESIRG